MPSPFPTIHRLNAAFEQGSADPVRITEQALQAASSRRDIFTVLTEARAGARKAAERLRSGKRLGLLDGIPVSWKDLFDQAGETTRAASRTTAHQAPASNNAAAVDLLEQQGAVSVGRTNLTEFAFSGLGLNPNFGTPANVWSPAHTLLTPGGSSSGAAVSVAEGIVAYAIGTDSSGSVRIPAALNGLTGFKPTAARVSRIGVWPLSPTLDSIGPLAHTVADVCAVMQGFGMAPAKFSGSLQIVVPTDCYGEDAEPSIQQAFERTLGYLKTAGCEIIRRQLAALAQLPELFAEYGTLVGIEAYRLHHAALAQAELMDPRVASRLQSNQSYPAANLAHLLNRRSQLQQLLRQELQGALLAMPTTAIHAPPLGKLAADDRYFAECNAKILRNTMAGSFLDLPSLTLPTGLDGNGLPAALMLSAPSGSDENVLAAGLAVAQALTGDTVLNEQRA
ncbi:hypothetical protein A7P95_04425 [Eikenella longinqua]|uniref:Amidase domain-containing protein n=1 Tax=Eikenella longinqua TaxID=1795827 RepID=A0A1A9RYY6_9NEIS|nr:amidase family protein [Eikenella longinqua]OAM29197.1 hypothetical protein A7P95_04425 [Eikenella longinqua]